MQKKRDMLLAKQSEVLRILTKTSLHLTGIAYVQSRDLNFMTLTQNFDHGHHLGYHEEVEIVKGGMTVERLEGLGAERLGKHLHQTSQVSKYDCVQCF